MHGRGVYVALGHVWWGGYVVGGICGRGHAWQGVCGGGMCMQETGETAIEADGTHPTGMQFCSFEILIYESITKKLLRT